MFGGLEKTNEEEAASLKLVTGRKTEKQAVKLKHLWSQIPD